MPIATAAEKSKNIRYRITYENGKLKVETIANANNPKGCDKARALIEQSMGIGDSVVDAKSSHPLEEKINTPSPEQIEEVENLQEKF